MWGGRLLRACLLISAVLAATTATRPAHAQANFDRPGSDYQSSPVASGDPADCALVCERDRRCRAWSFNYPTDTAGGAVCWLKSSVPARIQDNCCVSGGQGAKSAFCSPYVVASASSTVSSGHSSFHRLAFAV